MSSENAVIAAKRDGEIDLGPARSGRRFVIGAVVVIAVLWGTLFLVFREWRTRHRELAAFGASEVATVVDPLTGRVPPGVDAKRWRRAVADTHAMLVAATASGTLDRPAMEHLRDDLRGRLARTTPDTAISDLSRLWDEMQDAVGPILTGRASRPPFCPPRPLLLGGEGD
jgi:hypothetical protein